MGSYDNKREFKHFKADWDLRAPAVYVPGDDRTLLIGSFKEPESSK